MRQPPWRQVCPFASTCCTPTAELLLVVIGAMCFPGCPMPASSICLMALLQGRGGQSAAASSVPCRACLHHPCEGSHTCGECLRGTILKLRRLQHDVSLACPLVCLRVLTPARCMAYHRPCTRPNAGQSLFVDLCLCMFPAQAVGFIPDTFEWRRQCLHRVLESTLFRALLCPTCAAPDVFLNRCVAAG